MNRICILQGMSLFLVVCLLSACCSMSSAPQAPAGASIADALPNAEYPIDVASSGKAQLKNGVFEETAVPGSATKTVISIGKEHATGDLNGDGMQDAAVTLIADPGGSGTFIYLAAAINRNGTVEPVACFLLGDRIIVKSIAIESRKILVTLLTRKPDEPMAAKPTVEVKRVFKLRGNSFVEENGEH